MAASSAQAHRFIGAKTLSGCRPVPMSPDEIGCYEGRYEYWDADSELAWMRHVISPRHEEPRMRLVALVSDIARIRGNPIAMYGTADLQERDAHGGRLIAAQADQLIYLDRPERPPEMIVVGAFPLPDVVFEVDRPRTSASTSLVSTSRGVCRSCGSRSPKRTCQANGSGRA